MDSERPAGEGEAHAGTALDESPPLVVAIGASAGGLTPLQRLLDSLPSEMNAAFVVVVHQDPSGRTLLADLLARSSRLPVEPAQEGRRIEAAHIYVAPPGSTLSLEGGVLHILGAATDGHPPHPIDATFWSLATDRGPRVVGVVLSGNGSDGTLGLEAIRSEGGMTMVQDPTTAEYDGMPRSAIDNGCADYVLPVAAMLNQLLAHGEARLRTVGETADDDAVVAREIDAVIALVRAHTGHDFSFYRRSTLRRRIARRMGLHRLQSHQAYVELLRVHPEEVDELFREMLIGVTSFFRDAEAFETLRPALRSRLERRGSPGPFRVWVPGCSTGEEAYSLAMTLRECMDEIGRDVPLQIFATDLDPVVIERARSGHFSEAVMADVSAERLARFFTSDNGGYLVRPLIREPIVFAVQNVISEPPFTRLDLLSCRNLLIYMTRELQDELLASFEYAILPGGLLFLGSAETLGAQSEAFDTLDRRWNIFRRSERPPSGGLRQHAPRPPLPYGDEATLRLRRRPSVIEAADHALLTTLVPPTVIVSANGDVHHIHGRTGKVLEPSPGEPTMNLFRMARDGLQPVVATLVRRAAAGDSPAAQSGIRLRANGNETVVDVRAVKLAEPSEVAGLVAVTFEAHELPTAHAEGDHPPIEAPPVTEARIGELERELRHLEQQLELERACSATLLEGLPTAAVLLDPQLRVLGANAEFQTTFGVPLKGLQGRSLFEVEGGGWDVPALRESIEKLTQRGNPIEGLEVQRRSPAHGPVQVFVSGSRPKTRSRLSTVLLSFCTRGQFDGERSRGSA